MIVGYHLIWTAYGWWLPNDPRGSLSDGVAAEAIAELGEHHYGRKEIQPSGAEIRYFYEQARDVLQHDLLRFTAAEVASIAASFAAVCAERTYTCYACAIMPDHVHAVIRRHRDHGPEVITHLQEASRERLHAEGHRAADHPVWGGPGWTVFLNTQLDYVRTIEYVEKNPIKARLPAQQWDFVTKYDGWMPPAHLHTKHLPKRARYSRRRKQ